jgi:hypothetical protein
MVDFVSTNAMSMLGGDDYTSIQQSIVNLDASVVHKTGNLDESINGKKTFVSDLTVSNKNTNITSTNGIVNITATDPGLTDIQGKINLTSDVSVLLKAGLSVPSSFLLTNSNFVTKSTYFSIYNQTGTTSMLSLTVSDGSFKSNGVTKFSYNATDTTLTNVANTITSTTGDNTLTTSGGNNKMTITGGSFRENILTANANSSLANRIVGFNNYLTGSDTNYLFAPKNSITANTTSNGSANLIDATGTGGGNTIRTNTGTNTITSSNSGVNSIANTINATGANSYNRLQQTGSSGQNLIIAAASDNSAVNRIASNAGVNYANQLDAYGAGGNELKNVSGVNYLTTTSGSNRLTVNGSDKIITFSTETYNTNNVIYEIFYSSYNVRWVDSFGSTYTQLAIDGANTLIYNQNSITTRVNGKERIYNQSDRNEYRFNPTGTSTQVWRLYDNGTANVLYCLQSTTALNGVYLPNGANGWSAWSDERIKKNIKPIDTALTDILNLKPVFYNYKGDDDTQALRAGFIAQEVQQVYPDLINESSMDSGDIKNLLGLDMTNLVPYLVKAIQDLNKKVEEQALIINKLSIAMI